MVEVDKLQGEALYEALVNRAARNGDKPTMTLLGPRKLDVTVRSGKAGLPPFFVPQAFKGGEKFAVTRMGQGWIYLTPLSAPHIARLSSARLRFEEALASLDKFGQWVGELAADDGLEMQREASARRAQQEHEARAREAQLKAIQTEGWGEF